ncbi:hypothetical protein ACFY9Q_22040 [Streptomyces sp. NPDC012389]|uniref:hypothetical protein n=1 Tax=unclassified Streptomyces TaxID=2593676 RepID=UPI001F45E919|nr:hypothetical protein [Streptomyces sp. SID8374]
MENEISGGTFHGPVFQAGSFRGDINLATPHENTETDELEFLKEFMSRQRESWKEEKAAQQKKAAERRAEAEKKRVEEQVGCIFLFLFLTFTVTAFVLTYFFHNWLGLASAALAYVCLKGLMSD